MLTLVIASGNQRGKQISCPEGSYMLGRAVQHPISLSEPHLSSDHGILRVDATGASFEDLRSTNGSRLRRGENLREISGNISLQHGDELLLGDPTQPVVLQVIIEQEEDLHSTVVSSRSLADLPKYEDTLQQDPARLRALYRATSALSQATDFESVLEALAKAVFEILPKATHLTIALSDENDSKRIVPILTRGKHTNQHETPTPTSKTIIARIVRERAALQIADAMAEIGSKSICGAQICSVLGAPLRIGDEVRGVLLIDSRASHAIFSEQDLELLVVLASQISLSVENARLIRRLRQAEERLEKENRFLKGSEAKRRFKGIIGQSRSMAKVFEQITKVMDTRVTVAIEGETGTGKELVASMIHYQGNRREKLFVAQNCAAMPETLLESELFGHKKGSFTNAHEDKKGLFEIADGGTIFLDEVGEMSLSLQSKLLRVLQEGEIRPLGANTTKKIDVRIISATNRNLEEEVAQGRFRSDLFYRLCVFPIQLPPLRQRREDIPFLAAYFLKKYGEEMGRPMAGMSQEAMNLLCAYQWPGNVRELENEMQRVVIQGDPNSIVTPDLLSARVRQAEQVAEKLSGIQVEGASLKDIMDRLEKAVLLEALQEHNNNKTHTAQALGITREGLHKKLAKFGIGGSNRDTSE